MTKTVYRFEAVTEDKLSDGKTIKFGIYPDIFFDSAKEQLNGDLAVSIFWKCPKMARSRLLFEM